MSSVRLLMAAIVSVLSAQAVAGSYDSFLLNLYRLERCGFMSTSETAKASRVDICRQALADADSELDKIDDADANRKKAVSGKWRELAAIYNTALKRPALFREPSTADQIRFGREDIVSQLEAEVPQPPSPVALAIQLEQIATEYVWRAESVMGAGLSATEVKDIGEMVQEADKQFDVVMKAHATNIDLQAAYAKYQFMHSSLINYNTNMVPYIVDLYTDKITQTLGSIDRT